jgi:hypothetical protein
MGGGTMCGRALLALTFCLAASAAGCRRELPPRLPSTAIHDRTASRVALVDFVIADRVRAKKVRALYVEIERLMLDAHRVEMGQAREQATLGAGRLVTEGDTRASVAISRDAEMSALERYVCVQMAIRSLTTPAEFARLDAIK